MPIHVKLNEHRYPQTTEEAFSLTVVFLAQVSWCVVLVCVYCLFLGFFGGFLFGFFLRLVRVKMFAYLFVVFIQLH